MFRLENKKDREVPRGVFFKHKVRLASSIRRRHRSPPIDVSSSSGFLNNCQKIIHLIKFRAGDES
jgi:hypothetical protein